MSYFFVCVTAWDYYKERVLVMTSSLVQNAERKFHLPRNVKCVALPAASVATRSDVNAD